MQRTVTRRGAPGYHIAPLQGFQRTPRANFLMNVTIDSKLFGGRPRATVILCLLVLLTGNAARGAQDVSKVRAAENHIRQKDYAKAVEILEPLVQTNPRFDAEVYVMLAVSRVNLGEKEKAVAACERGLDAFPDSGRLAEFYVSLLNRLADRAEAKAKLEGRLARNARSPVLTKALGQILLDENPLDPRTEQLLMTAAAESPRDAEAHYLYGQWACLNNREGLCLDALRKALALSPTNDLARMQIYTLIGIAEDKAGRHEPAEAAFQNALKLNRRLPRPDPNGALQYAKFLLDRQRPAEAEPLIDEALKAAPTFAPALFERAKLLAKGGRREKAIEAASLALQHTAANNKTQLHALHAFLAKTYFSLGRVEEAQTHQRWIESNP